MVTDRAAQAESIQLMEKIDRLSAESPIASQFSCAPHAENPSRDRRQEIKLKSIIMSSAVMRLPAGNQRKRRRGGRSSTEAPIIFLRRFN